eukprot:scaffold68779_cov63-Phaeocystis_antarctica.AAC.1
MSSIDLAKLTAAESPEDREAAATAVAKQVTSKPPRLPALRLRSPCLCVHSLSTVPLWRVCAECRGPDDQAQERAVERREDGDQQPRGRALRYAQDDGDLPHGRRAIRRRGPGTDPRCGSRQDEACVDRGGPHGQGADQGALHGGSRVGSAGYPGRGRRQVAGQPAARRAALDPRHVGAQADGPQPDGGGARALRPDVGHEAAGQGGCHVCHRRRLR